MEAMDVTSTTSEEEEICPQCNKATSNQSTRLIQDACGHRKCRVCLLTDEEDCKQCLLKVAQHCEVITKNNTANGEGESCILPNHIIANKNPSTFTCTICSKTLVTTKSNIKYHSYCSGDKKPFECDICQKQFVVKSHLETHILTHENKKPYSCEQCDKQFFERSKLNRHRTIHSNEKLFTCTQCGKSFRNKENLRTHSVIHRVDKPYKCSECEASFSHSSNLKKHLFKHSNEKHHMCDQCGKSFKLKWALTIHRRNHNKQRSHQCKVCAKAFTHLKDLIRHESIHVEAKEYTCGICNTSFRRKDNLKRHTKNTHPGNEPNIIKNSARSHVIVDNPNAIHVITTTKHQNKKKDAGGGCINAPFKLAFKTSAFKNNYNIHRDYVEAPMKEEINIYEKILTQKSHQSAVQHPIEESVTKEPANPINTDKTVEPCGPLHYETSFFNIKHAVIKNIKFKLPAKYTNLKSNDVQETRENLYFDELNRKTYYQLENVDCGGAAERSVIVNNDTHWRRRN